TIDVVPASMLNVPEQLSLITGAAMIGGDSLLAQYRNLLTSNFSSAVTDLDLTPSELSLPPRADRIERTTFDSGVAAHSGLAAHKILQSGVRPSVHELRRQNLEDLERVFESAEWKQLDTATLERELPFIMHVRVSDRDCSLRGRIDTVVFADPVRVI